jgi:hypothetical protein
MAVVAGGAGMAGASSRPAVSGTEHLQLVSTSATSNRAKVVLYGAFTAHAVDIQGRKVDTFKFADGSFTVAHSGGVGTQHFDPRTCLFMVSRHGTYTIGHGTGTYKGIKGSGKYQLNILGIAAKSGGKCAQNKPPAATQLIIRASGPVRL